MKKFLTLLLPVGLVVFAFVFAHFHPFLEKTFVLSTLDHQPLSLNQFAGQPIIVVFFSPRCGDCKEEMPYFEELYRTHQKDRLAVVGVGIKYQQEIENYVKQEGFSFPIVIDDTLEVSKSFGVFFIPHVVLFDKRGRIVYSEAGKIPKEKFQNYLERILFL